MKKFVALPLFFLVNLVLMGQSPLQPKRPSSADILIDMKQFAKPLKVLYVAAHPDDENTRLLSYLEKYRHVESAYLSLTRGDGGQNLIGEDKGVYLGVLRTHELLNARKIDGAQQYFSRAIDFGYSKNPEETFEHWPKEELIKDVVISIRSYRPDVIITRFPTTGEGGHGHHTASAILAEEAFDLAADSNYVIPEYNLRPHKTERLMWNSFSWRRDPKLLEEDVAIDCGKFIPELGKYIGELANEARSQHRCQGMGRALQRGDFKEYFKPIKGSEFEKDIFEGIDSTWAKYPNGDRIQSLINLAIINFDFSDPRKSINILQQIEREIESGENFLEQGDKLKQIRNIIIKCSGLYAEWTSENNTLTPNSELESYFEISAVADNITEIKFTQNGESIYIEKLGRERETRKIMLNAIDESDFIYSDIHHLKGLKPTEKDFFSKDPILARIPELKKKNATTAQLEFKINGRKYWQDLYLKHKIVEPSYGEQYDIVNALPKIAFQIKEKEKIAIRGKSLTLTVPVINRGSKSEVRLIAKGFSETLLDSLVTLKQGVVNNIPVFIKADSIYTRQPIVFSIEDKAGKKYTINERGIDYEHVPHVTHTENAFVVLKYVKLKEHKLKIAYLEGAGDLVPEYLSEIGIDIDVIEEDGLLNFNPSNYDAVVGGIRLYNVSENIAAIQESIMQYVKNGGTYIVQYNTRNFLSSMKTSAGPYPFKIGRDRVTVEQQPVKILEKDHPVFNTPYTITEDSWKNWTQERGLYFADEFETNYPPLLEMHDPNEGDAYGSLIYTKYGKGHFYYTGISFFRNLPSGVEGAYHLFLNMLEN